MVADLILASVSVYLDGVPDLLGARPSLADWRARATDRPAFRRMLEMRAAA